MTEPKDQIREAFEHWYSDEGAWPAAVERHTNGNYRLMQAVQSWTAWQAAWKAAHVSGVAPLQSQQPKGGSE